MGLDLSPHMSRLARKRLRRLGLAGLPLVRAPAQELPFAANAFDSVVATFPTPFIVQPDTLAEIARVLRPAGRLVIVAGARLTGRDPLSRFVEWLYRLTGQREIPAGDTWLEPFAQAGFSVRVVLVDPKFSGNLGMTARLDDAIGRHWAAMGIGSLSLPLGLTATDIHLHDTYYVIGHFHYVVAPGTIFALFAGVYYWFPKATGRKMSEFLGKLHFWPSLIFMNVIFMPMFVQGLAGVSRRLYDGGQIYAHAQPVLSLNKMMSFGAWGLAIAQIPFIINFFMSIKTGEKASDNPWDATTLEWVAPSPPPHGNFVTAPVVYRGAYEYSVPGEGKDFIPQNQPAEV